MVLPSLDESGVTAQTVHGVGVKADEQNVDNDAQLDPVLPVGEVSPLRVHHLQIQEK